MTRDPRGAGRSGGLLFLLVGVFVAYLAIEALTGRLRFVLVAALVAGLAALALNVVRRS